MSAPPFQFSEMIKIYVGVEPVDMRKAIDGLCIQVVEVLEQNPQSEQVFLFRNRSGNKIKILFWDKNGFILLYKRLEKGRFKFPTSMTDTHFEMDYRDLKWLLAGFDFTALKQHPELYFSDYS